jgi:tetratricopeptide (TPR) repeat protein
MTEDERYAPLRAALEQELRIEHILAQSADGAVYLAVDLALARAVMVRAIDRTRVGEAATESFAREAKLLASLSDPGIPAVHHASAVGSFGYIILEAPEGPTLEERLRSGPMPKNEVLRLGQQVLGALHAAHTAGFAHGRVHSRNLIVGDTHVVLDGFGAAVPVSDSAVRSDLEAVARVMREAATGTLPRQQRAAIERALSLAGQGKLDAAGFRALLEEASQESLTRNRKRSAVLGIALFIGMVSLVAVGSERSGRPGATPRQLAVLPLDVDGGQPLDPLGTYLAQLVQLGLRDIPELELTSRAQVDRWWREQTREDQPADGFTATRALRAHWVAYGVVDRRPDGVLRVRVSLYDSAGATRPLPEVRAREGDLAALSDSLALEILRVVAPRADQGLEPGGFADVPLTALKAFLQGEAAFARDQWALAQRHYEDAVGVDSSFALADWRLANIKRWRRVGDGTELAAVYARHVSRLRARDSFLLAALLEPDLGIRLAKLDTAIKRLPADGYARLLHAEELFHLGPLAGRGVDEALPVLADAVARDSSLALAYDHLVLGNVRFGRRAAAAVALELRRRVDDPERHDDFDMLSLLHLVYDERFVPWRAWLRAYLIGWRRDPRQLEGIERIARIGTSWLGMPQTQLRYCDLLLRAGPPVAETHGTAHEGKGTALFALGRLREALAELDSAATLLDSPQARLQQAEWRAIPAVVGYPGADTRAWEQRLVDLAADSSLGQRAAWVLALLAGDDTSRARLWIDRLPAGMPLRVMLDARLAAVRGDFSSALAISDSVRTAFQRPRQPDPFAGSVFHLLRGDWLVAAGQRGRADREWLWYEASDVDRWPQGLSQAGEIGAALGPLARLKRARALLSAGASTADTAAACTHLARVRELWSEADSAARTLLADASPSRACGT